MTIHILSWTLCTPIWRYTGNLLITMLWGSVLLMGCQVAPPPPSQTDIILTVTANVQAQNGTPLVLKPSIELPTLTATPNITPTDKPFSTVVPTEPPIPTDTPTPTPHPTAIEIELDPPTPIPPFPNNIIDEATLPLIHPLRQIGVGKAYQPLLSPSGSTVVVATSAGIVWFDVATQHIVRFFEQRGTIERMRFNAYGSLLATAWDAHTNNPMTRLFKSKDGSVIATLEGVQPAFSADGSIIATSRLITGTNKYTTWLWDTATGTKRNTLVGSDAVFSPDETTLATVEYGESSNDTTDTTDTTATATTLLWRMHDGALLRDVPGALPVFSPDKQWLATINAPTVYLWNMHDPTIVYSQTVEHVSCVSFDPTSQALRIAAYDGIHIWSIEGNSITDHFPVSGTFGTSPDILVQFLGGGEGLLQGIQLVMADDGTVAYQDATMLFADWVEHNEQRLVSFDANSRLVAMVGHNGFVRIVDLQDGTVTDMMVPAYDSVAFNHDGQYLATAHHGAVVDLWHTASGTRAAQFTPAKGASLTHVPYDIQIAPDGNNMVVQEHVVAYGIAFQVAATMWHIADTTQHDAGNEFWSLSELDGYMGSGITEPVWAVNSAQQQVAWVDANNQLMYQHGNEPHFLTTDPVSITALTFSPDGMLLATCNRDGYIQLIRTDSRFVFEDMQAGYVVDHMVFSPDGRLLAALRSDGVVRVWLVGEHRLLSQIDVGNQQDMLITTSNHMLITWGSDVVTCYHIESGTLLYTMPIAADDVAMEPVQWYLAVLHDGIVTLWGVPNL